MNIKATWTGEFPCLCNGHWELTVDGKDVFDLIPEDLRFSDMNTYGEYSCFSFNDDWSEEWESYEDGLHCEEWISANKEWLNAISEDEEVQRQIFEAINAEDWRHRSCGGCI